MNRELRERSREQQQLSPEACQKAGTIACALCNACPRAAFAPKPPDTVVSSRDQPAIRALLNDDSVGSIGFEYGAKLRSPDPITLPSMPPRKTLDTQPNQPVKPAPPPKPPAPRRVSNGETFSEAVADFFALMFGLKSLASVSKSQSHRR